MFLIIPNSLTKIESNAFKNCFEIRTLIIGSSVETICDNAFSGCRQLRSIRLSSSVKSIGDNAFAGADDITYVSCKSLVPPVIEYQSSVFSENIDNAILAVPAGSENDYKEAEGWKNFKHYEEAITTSIYLYKTSIDLEVGEWEKLDYWMDGEYYIGGDYIFKWISSNTDIVTVDYPYVKGVNPGRAIVKILFDAEVYNSCEVNVIEKSGIKDIDTDPIGVKVYADGSIIKITNATIGNLCNVYRIDGQLLQSIKLSDTIAETSPISSGVYIVKVGDSVHKVLVP